MYFCVFDEKHVFAVLAGNRVLRFWRGKRAFAILVENTFLVLAGKVFLRFWRKKLFYGFGRKHVFTV